MSHVYRESSKSTGIKRGKNNIQTEWSCREKLCAPCNTHDLSQTPNQQNEIFLRLRYANPGVSKKFQRVWKMRE